MRLHSGSRFLSNLRKEIADGMDAEVDLTLRVAVCAAAQMTRPQIHRALERQRGEKISETEIRMAFIRLKRVAGEWKEGDDE